MRSEGELSCLKKQTKTRCLYVLKQMLILILIYILILFCFVFCLFWSHLPRFTRGRFSVVRKCLNKSTKKEVGLPVTVTSVCFLIG